MIKLTKAAKTKQFPDEISKNLYNKYGGVSEDIFYEKLKKLKKSVKNIAVSTLKIQYLKEQGLPDDCTIMFSNTTQVYVDKKGFERIYNNTTAYIGQKSKKYIVSKNYPYPAKLNGVCDVNNPDNPICRLFMQERLELKRENEYIIECEKNIAKLYCNSINSLPLSKKVRKINLEEEIDNAYEELIASDERQIILRQLGELVGIEYCIIAEDQDVLQKYTFDNKILDENGQRFRSKNEMIAAKCLQDAGASYNLEPFYPGTNMRADFCLICSQKEFVKPTEIKRLPASMSVRSVEKKSQKTKQIFVEITGKRGDEKYEKKLMDKKILSKKMGIPLIFIDMTDYPDEAGKVQTHLEYEKLRKIFQKVCFGYVRAKGQFVTPY